MLNSLLADAVMLIHFLFIAFAALGGLLVLRHRRWIFWHLPVLCWASLVMLLGWVCPLTPLEFELRAQGHVEEGFIAHYLWPLIYPQPLTRTGQVGLGLLLLLFNLLVYATIIRRWLHNNRINDGES